MVSPAMTDDPVLYAMLVECYQKVDVHVNNAAQALGLPFRRYTTSVDMGWAKGLVIMRVNTKVPIRRSPSRN